jgi:hypothetical protein
VQGQPLPAEQVIQQIFEFFSLGGLVSLVVLIKAVKLTKVEIKYQHYSMKTLAINEYLAG